MFICNVKLNKKTIFKTSLAIMTIICLSIGAVGIYKIFSKAKKDTFNVIDDSIPHQEIVNINPEDYTNILKAVHENIDTYIGQKISFSGYIYRLNNFNKNQFVLARDMDIGNNQTLIVGFLCEFEKATNFENYTWVTVSGEITKGNYNGEIPILKIFDIKKSQKPESANVCLPEETYIPTAVIY